MVLIICRKLIGQ